MPNKTPIFLHRTYSQPRPPKAAVDELNKNLLDISLANLAPQIQHLEFDDVDSQARDKSQAVDTTRPSPYTKVASKILGLEGEAEKCNMAKVSYHLPKESWLG